MGRGRAQKSIEFTNRLVEIAEELGPVTGRGVGYHAFTEGLITEMSTSEMAKVYRALRIARENDELDWDAIVDETREVESVAAWTDIEEYAADTIAGYRRDYWNQQPKHVEVWSEKGTIRGILSPVLDEHGVSFRVMHGFASATAVHNAAQASVRDVDHEWIVFYVGDFDPSGLHMSKVDLPKRIEEYGGVIDLRRIALIEKDCTPKLPSFSVETKGPTAMKKGDPRYRWFKQHHGRLCWELDALDPRILRRRVEAAIKKEIEPTAWERCKIVERAEHRSLEEVMAALKT